MKVYPAAPSARAAATPYQDAMNWHWLYGLGPLLVGLLLVVHHRPFSGTGHLLLQGAIVLLVYGLLALGLQANHAAVGVPKPAEKRKIVYMIYTPSMDNTGDESMSSLTDAMPQRLPQGISLAALPLCDNMSLQDRRN